MITSSLRWVSTKCLLSESWSLCLSGPLKNGCSFEDDLSLGAEGKYSPLSPLIVCNCSQVCCFVRMWQRISRIPRSFFEINGPTDKQEWLLALFCYVCFLLFFCFYIYYSSSIIVVCLLSNFVLLSVYFLIGLCAALSLHKDRWWHANSCMWYSG